MLDAGTMIASLGQAQAYTLQRTAVSGYGSNGLFQPGTVTTLQIIGVDLPMSDFLLVQSEQGSRSEDRRFFYSVTPVLGPSEDNQTPADVIVIGGVNYVVQNVKNYPCYCRAEIVRQKAGESA